jgi:hypothetical protein
VTNKYNTTMTGMLSKNPARTTKKPKLRIKLSIFIFGKGDKSRKRFYAEPKVQKA